MRDFQRDVINAVSREQAHDPARALAGSLKNWLAWVRRDEWEAILDAFARCVRITRGERRAGIFA